MKTGEITLKIVDNTTIYETISKLCGIGIESDELVLDTKCPYDK